MDYFQQVRMTWQENPDAPDEPKQDQERVYVVRLTEEAVQYWRSEIGDQELFDDPLEEEMRLALASARPEHPERQAALEEFTKLASRWITLLPDDAYRAYIRLRSLEEKREATL